MIYKTGHFSKLPCLSCVFSATWLPELLGAILQSESERFVLQCPLTRGFKQVV